MQHADRIDTGGMQHDGAAQLTCVEPIRRRAGEDIEPRAVTFGYGAQRGRRLMDEILATGDEHAGRFRQSHERLAAGCATTGCRPVRQVPPRGDARGLAGA